MRIHAYLYIVTALLLISPLSIHADPLKPFILAKTQQGQIEKILSNSINALEDIGFKIVGQYAPFLDAVVICATNDELIAAASATKNGGFGVIQRISLTKVNNKIQIAYVNPEYLGVAYGLGKLDKTVQMLKKSLGREKTFGSEKGITAKNLQPGQYHYAVFMPYFYDVEKLNSFSSYETAIDTVEKNLAASKGGTKKVYRFDFPGEQISVFGVAINPGDGTDKGTKDTDREILDIVDYKELKHTAYLPYELMIVKNRAIALHGRYRIALHFPDTAMMGKHGFTKIMSAPKGIKTALRSVTGSE